jgi:membrane protein involved in colicin uptake
MLKAFSCLLGVLALTANCIHADSADTVEAEPVDAVEGESVLSVASINTTQSSRKSSTARSTSKGSSAKRAAAPRKRTTRISKKKQAALSKAASDKAASDKAASDKAASDKAASDKASADYSASHTQTIEKNGQKVVIVGHIDGTQTRSAYDVNGKLIDVKVVAPDGSGTVYKYSTDTGALLRTDTTDVNGNITNSVLNQ